jgi:hypothetical protein
MSNTKLQKLEENEQLARSLYERALNTDLQKEILSIRERLSRVEKELEEAKGNLTKPLLHYSYKGFGQTKKYANKAAQTVWALMNRVDYIQAQMAEQENRNLEAEIIKAKKEWETASYLLETEKQLAELLAQKVKRVTPEKAPVEMESFLTIPTTGENLNRVISPWTDYVEVEGIIISVPVLKEFARSLDKDELVLQTSLFTGKLSQGYGVMNYVEFKDIPSLVISTNLSKAQITTRFVSKDESAKYKLFLTESVRDEEVSLW